MGDHAGEDSEPSDEKDKNEKELLSLRELGSQTSLSGEAFIGDTDPTERHGSIKSDGHATERLHADHHDREPDSPRLFIVTAPVEGTDEGIFPGDDCFDYRFVAQGTERLARERFHGHCATLNYEVLKEPTVEEITLEEVLEHVNDPDSSIRSISTPDMEPRSDSDST